MRTLTHSKQDPPTQSSSASSSRPLTAIPAPVPSLPAAVSDDAHDDNVNFLRSRVRSPPDLSSSLSRQRRGRLQNLMDFDIAPLESEDFSNTRIESNRRIPIVRRLGDNSTTHRSNTSNPNSLPNYEGRMSNPRSLYGWAPASDDEDEETSYEPLHNNSTLAWFGRYTDRHAAPRSPRHEAAVRSLRAAIDEPAENSTRAANESPYTMADALVHSIRRQHRPARTRTLQNYLVERERVTQAADELRERPGTNSTTRATHRFLSSVPSIRSEPNRPLTHNDLRARINAHRQLHMENPPSPRLKEAIRYLDRLRYSTSFEESLIAAAAGGFVHLEFINGDEDDLIIDTASIAPPPESSWLRPGVVFSGSQRAASSASSLFAQRVASPSSPHDPLVVNGSDFNRINVSTTTGRRYLANNIYNLGGAKDENWPVKVTIHNINHQDMTLTGTMEAYNIPDKTSPSHDAHIVTYLEGEIIDFNKHTLETKNFKADAEIDSTYWRELQPFKNLTDEEMTRNLVSHKWVTGVLSKGWILMRWKERCFITPTDSRQGLTISGFYYISLNRENGHIEGLYYDPGSSPYQQLSLNPETRKMVRPSYGFR
ncbi:uncharacterized protein BO97DRAFT_407300 [Aspergillus homomorphus CBS 101889]|uniref:Vacuolar import and degradation protein n=1 Tax=Aspergillus homomorphus (strain CBS 101889) TaxID=1450537 RepID=A0A395HT19_ASPHC|nr:hypothetical protein BO97DRAFT_407300 [Aspergillus homomorphus CBS 101889]RAL09988.1 hypothetical protein BO97DRAFT_407300 [Aspergillus homomorphus CBS 101889]